MGSNPTSSASATSTFGKVTTGRDRVGGLVQQATIEATEDETGEVPLDAALAFLGDGGPWPPYLRWKTHSELTDIGYLRQWVPWQLGPWCYRSRLGGLAEHCTAESAATTLGLEGLGTVDE